MEFSQNYFELLGVPEQFDLDVNVLSQRYRELQREFHPDHCATKSAAERRRAVQFSSYINTAFQTLKSVVARAEYLLTLRGESIDHQTTTVNDGAFLMLQMEWRESLADIAVGNIEVAESLLEALSASVKKKSLELQEQFQQQYLEKNFSDAKQTTAKLHFTEKMLHEIETIDAKLFD